MPLATSIGRIGTRALLRGLRSAGSMAQQSRVSLRDKGRTLYQAGLGVHRGWRRLPPIVRYGVVAGGIGTYSGIKATQGLISGWRQSFQSSTDMYNHAHKYSAMGNEKHKRNQGRMPENHMSHAGLVQSLSRLRHG